MKILYSTLINPESQSAAGQHISSVVEHWKKQGHQVKLLYPAITIGVEYKESEEKSNPALLLERFKKDWSFSSAVLKELNSQAYDLVYHRFAHSSIFPVIRTRIRGIPVVLEVNAGLDADLKVHWGENRLMATLIRILGFLQNLLVNRIIAVSEGLGEKLRSSLAIRGSKVVVVPNGVDLEQFHPISKSDAQQELGIIGDRPVLVYAGGFHPYQGVDVIIKAARLLYEDGFPVQIFLVGAGMERDYLQELVKRLELGSLVYFPGWCSPAVTAKYLGASDICLAPYTREALLDPLSEITRGAYMKGSPLKILTYLAAGRPVIASHFDEAGILVEKYKAGLAIPPGDPEILVKHIRALANDPSMQEVMGINARKIAELKFGWENTSRAIALICGDSIL